MGRGRYYLMCGKVKTGSGSIEVVAAGGSDDAVTSLDAVEIYSVGSGTWRNARPLPLAIYGASVVQLEDSFLIVGGYREGWPSNISHHNSRHYRHYESCLRRVILIQIQ